MKLLASFSNAIVCALIGAGMAIAGKSLVASLSAMVLVFLRASIACLFLLPFVNLKKIRDLTTRDILMLLAGGVIGIYLANVLFYKGLTTSSAFNSSLINALSPLLTLLAICLYLKKLPTRTDLFSFLLALCGVLLVITNGNLDIQSLLHADGNLLILMSVIASIAYSIAAKHRTAALSSSEFAFSSFFISTLLLIPNALYDGLITTVPALTMPQWLMILYLSLAGSTIGFYLFTQSIAKIGPDITAYIVYSLAPLFVLIINFVFFKEAITTWQLLGTFCILGSLIVQIHGRHTAQLTRERNA